MSTIFIHTIAQAEQAANSPNWLLIGIILGVMVLLAVVFLVPSRKPLAGEDEKKLPGEGDKALEDKSKEDLSLSEIKESKRAAVSEDKTKEELRELRKERRAATQTEKAIHDREESSETAEAKEEKAEKAEEKVEAVAQEAKVEEEAPKVEDLGVANDLLAKTDADASDVFATLFGGGSQLNFDEEIGNSGSSADGPVIPTLGSALISLDDLTRAAEAEREAKGEESTDDEFAGLSMFSQDSEKKTLN